MNSPRSSSHRFLLPLSLALAACAAEPAPPVDPVEDDVAQLEAELALLPGELVVTTSSDMPFSNELRAKLATADKVIHRFADGTVHGYLGAREQPLPDDVPVFRVFRDLHGEIVIGNQQDLPAYLEQQDPQKAPHGISEAVGLPIGTGGLWPDSTVAYVIDGSISDPGELAALRQAITTWNTSVDPSGIAIKVRFVPRYWADNRPYIQFVRGGSGGCGASAVGRHNLLPNGFSHNINLDCFDQRTILHEMGHTAGLYHEQQRCDRDSFVNVTYPYGIDCERYCGGNSASYGPYNYLSVMHYPYNTTCSILEISPTASGFRGTPAQAGTIPALDTFDVQAINQMYFGAASLPPIGPGRYYSLVPQYTTKVVAVPASSHENGKQLILFDRLAGVADQHWSLLNESAGHLELRPQHSPEKCMEDWQFFTSNGTPIVQYDCWNGDNQKWIIAPSAGAPGYFDIINKYSGKSLDVWGWGDTNGTLIEQWDHTNGTNQRFGLSPAS